MRMYFFLATLALAAIQSKAQKLPELLKEAITNYPLLKSKKFEVQARKDIVSYTKSSALPSLDAAYQLNYATYNNITGMATSQNFVAISGPPSSTNDYSGVFGSVGGLLMNWEPFTFGQRKSKIESAKAYQSYQEADESQEIFRHQIRTANAYLDVVLANELVKAYSKNLKRAENNARIVKSLTRSGLRPGTDTSLFNAELSRAKIDLLNFEKLHETQKVALSEMLGATDYNYDVDSSLCTILPNPTVSYDPATQEHPLITLSKSRVAINESEETTLKRSLNPKLSFWGTGNARGSGVHYDGSVNSKDGLSFSRYNYGAGLVLSVPLLRFTTVRYQVRAQSALIQSENEKMNLVKLQLRKQNQIADVTLMNALKIANESPSFYQSAAFSYRTLLSRYNSGLINYVELIQSQYVLIKSEADLKKSYVEAWKALLYKAAVEGDINIFLNQLN